MVSLYKAHFCISSIVLFIWHVIIAFIFGLLLPLFIYKFPIQESNVNSRKSSRLKMSRYTAKQPRIKMMGTSKSFICRQASDFPLLFFYFLKESWGESFYLYKQWRKSIFRKEEWRCFYSKTIVFSMFSLPFFYLILKLTFFLFRLFFFFSFFYFFFTLLKVLFEFC